MTTLFTIGYQGQTIESFLELLQAHGITHVLDIRQLPQSRKPDFGKRRLSAHLAAVAISYTHMVELGTPKELRDRVRHDHDYVAFFAAMAPFVAAQPAALDLALEQIMTQPCVLLCFEADHNTCHRLTVAEALVQRAQAPLQIVHLGE